MDEELLDRYAELIVGFGANVQPDQVVAVEGPPEAAPLIRRIARGAYERGARYVDVVYFDPLVKRIRIESATEDSLTWIPPWLGRRLLDLGEFTLPGGGGATRSGRWRPASTSSISTPGASWGRGPI